MTYSVNADGGYVAEVSYEGTAVFPEVQELFIFFQTLSYISEYLWINCMMLSRFKLIWKSPGEALRPTSDNRLSSLLYRVYNITM